MSWLHCMWGVGTTLGPYIMGAVLTGGAAWNKGYRVISLLQIVLTVVLIVSLPKWKEENPAGEETRGGKPLTFREIISIPGAKAIMLCFFCYCAVEQTTMLWASSYLNLAKGIDAKTAASFAGIFWSRTFAGHDILGSQRCDCGEQLHKAMEMIEKEGKGVVVYLNQEGRGIGLMEKMKAYKLQEDGMDTVDANICLGHLADERDYGVGAQILRELGVHKMRLLTNNPVKRVGLEAYGLEIVENVPVETVPNPYNERYLRTKKERMGHTLHFNK